MASLEDRRQVYRTCRAIFSGQKAQFRKDKIVRKVLLDNKASLEALFERYGEDTLVEIVRQLLEDRTFASELKAKAAFPSLFHTTPERDAQREASEANAAKFAAEALYEIDQSQELCNEDSLEAMEEPSSDKLYDDKSDDIFSKPEASASSSPGSPHPSIPTLYPSYLPYKAQHAILNTVQRVLEESCFDFVRQWLPELVQKQGWECASAVELTKWAHILKQHQLPPFSLASTEPSLREAITSTHKLRHTAVHRLRTTARGISQLLQTALTLAELLQDVSSAAKLEELKLEVDDKIKAIELIKNSLEDRATSKLADIQRQREELDRQERQLVEDMIREDRDNMTLIGSLLEGSVEKIFKEGRKDLNSEDLDSAGVEDEVNGTMPNGVGGDDDTD